jgi:hypothetical protein
MSRLHIPGSGANELSALRRATVAAPARVPSAQQRLLTLNKRAAALHLLLGAGILAITIAKWDTTFALRLTQPQYDIPTKFSTCQIGCYNNAQFDRLSPTEKLYRTQQIYTVPREVLSVPVGVLVTLFAWITAAFHLLLATRWSERYLTWVFQEQRQPARWAEYSITASVMTCVVASLCGVQDANTQLGLFMMTAATMLVGYSIETAPSKATGLSPEQWGWFAFGMALFVATWTIILTRYVKIKQFLQRKGRRLVRELEPLIDFPPKVKKNPEIPSFVDWTTINIVILFLLFAAVCLVAHNVGDWTARYGHGSGNQVHAFVTGERQFVWLSFISKAFLVIMIGSAALRDDPPTYMA